MEKHPELTQEDIELLEDDPELTQGYPKLTQEQYAYLVGVFEGAETSLRRFIYRELRNEKCGNKDLEEILGMVYDTAYKRFKEISTSKNPIGWLMLVARNKLLTYFRNSRRVEALETTKIVRRFRDEIDLGLDEIFPKEFKQAERDVLERKYIHDDTVKEIAGDLHENVNTIKKRLMTAKEKARKIFKKF